MSSNTTQEQQAPIDYLQTHDGLVLMNAIAGSGKTHSLIELTEQIKHKSGRYLAYNKSIATEASGKFPKTIDCRTTHSLAYQNTVKPLKLRIGNFGYKDIHEKVSYEHKCEVVDNIREFCLSKHTDFEEYAEEVQLTDLVTKMCMKYLNLMHEAKIECTHEFYLKLFHILLASGDIEFDELDLLLLDESGDLNEVTLEIFLLLPARKKVAVGDKHQNIYGFNHTINAFQVLEGQGVEFNLSQSFRVHEKIANQIEPFCHKYLDPDMRFKGIAYDDMTIKSRAFIARTNAQLVDKMIELNKDKVPYGLVRRAADIFKVPLMVCGLTYQGKIYDPAYKHIQDDIDEWYETPALRDTHKSFLSYLAAIYEHDIPLINAIKLVGKHGKALIIETYDIAKRHEKAKCDFVLSTAHSSKGLEFDEVIIGDDMNQSVAEIIERLKVKGEVATDPADIEALNLAYVAASRARKSLINARFLTC